jgi:predicted nuclease of restriction endonuclease-like (RecB) superfamily
MTVSPIPEDYKSLLTELKQRIRSAQYEALKVVNQQLIVLYWDIGKLIASRQQGATWGKAVVEQLAKDLQAEFPGITGFSSRNIWRMRDFYLSYQQNEKLPPVVAEISWSHNIVILEKCKDSLEQEFYIRMSRRFGWTKNVLIHQIENQTYEKTLLNQTNFEQTLPESIQHQAKLAVKDEYTFDFLELGDEHSERQLEMAIIARVKPFLKEMGGMFAFIDSQYRLEIDGEEYFIDLLLYHRGLKSLVAIELKIGKFIPEHVGKMQFYLAALEAQTQLPDENAPIGIILCKSKQQTTVEYALKNSNQPIGVGSYTMTSSPPQTIKDQLPAPEQIAKLLEGIESP